MTSGLADVGFTIRAEGAEKVKAVFKDLLDAAKNFETQLSKTVKSEGEKRARVRTKIGDDQAKAEQRQTKEQEKEARKREREKERELAQVGRLTQRWRREEETAHKRHLNKLEADEKRSHEARKKLVQGVGSRIRGDLGRIAGVGGVAAGLLGAVGGGIAVTDAVSQNIKNNATARELSNATGVSKEEIYSTATSVARKEGFETSETLAGIGAFVKTTGNMKMAKTLMGDIAKLSNATGVSFEKLASAAGQVFNADQTMDAKTLMGTLRDMTAQSETGSVELEDLAKSGARVTQTAAQFGGDRVTNTRYLTALAELSKKAGTATTADEATMSVSSLFKDIMGNEKDFKKLGIAVKDKNNIGLNPEKIIEQALVQTKGDASQLQKLFGARSYRAVEGLNRAYSTARATARNGGASEAEAANAGLAAVHEMLKEFKEATYTEQQIEERAAKRKEETDKRIAIASEQLRLAIGEKLTPKLVELIPTLERLIPSFVSLLDKMVRLTEWIAGNPFQAATIGLSAVIAKAFVQEIVAAKIGSILTEQLAGVSKGAGSSAAQLALLTGALTAALISLQAFGAALDSATNEDHGVTADGVIKNAANGDAAALERVRQVEEEGTGLWGDTKRAVRGVGGTALTAIGAVSDTLFGTNIKADGKRILDNVAVDSRIASQLDSGELDAQRDRNLMQASKDFHKAAQKMVEASKQFGPPRPIGPPPPPSTSGKPPSTDGQN